MKHHLNNFVIVLMMLLAGTSLLAQEASSPQSARELRLAEFLKRNPESDADKDGKLTLDEFKVFQQRRRSNDAAQDRGEDRQRRRVDEQKGNRFAASHADVPYGTHEKQRFDIWLVPESTKPTPLVVFIHGGGFRGGDKSGISAGQIKKFLDAGVAFASINYRLSDSGPYPIMMHDAARCLQTIRHRAKEWHLDPKRIACFGGSAGAGISLWLAFHDDLADSTSDDPIARQSTRILAAGTMNGQSTYDMHTDREWFNVPDLPIHNALPSFYGIAGESDIEKDSVRKLMKDASPITHLSRDDQASVYMMFGRPNTKVTKSTSQGEWVHHVLLGLKLQEAMKPLGLECYVTAPGIPAENHPYGSLEEFLISKVQAAPTNR
ncbi:MAG: alpha/beta hydrolase [Pirellulaceae bacterium]